MSDKIGYKTIQNKTGLNQDNIKTAKSLDETLVYHGEHFDCWGEEFRPKAIAMQDALTAQKKEIDAEISKKSKSKESLQGKLEAAVLKSRFSSRLILILQTGLILSLIGLLFLETGRMEAMLVQMGTAESWMLWPGSFVGAGLLTMMFHVSLTEANKARFRQITLFLLVLTGLTGGLLVWDDIQKQASVDCLLLSQEEGLSDEETTQECEGTLRLPAKVRSWDSVIASSCFLFFLSLSGAFVSKYLEYFITEEKDIGKHKELLKKATEELVVCLLESQGLGEELETYRNFEPDQAAQRKALLAEVRHQRNKILLTLNPTN